VPKSLQPHPIDIHVGQRTAVRRKLLKLSQRELANHLGYGFRQIQKYERGQNRVSASTLYELSGALGVPVSFFFEGLPEKASDLKRLKETRAPTDFDNDPMLKSDVIKLVRDFERITDPKTRKMLAKTVSAAAAALTEGS